MTDAFRDSFRDTAYMYDHPQKVEAVVKTLMRDKCLSDITDLVAQTGAKTSPEQRDYYGKLTKQV